MVLPLCERPAALNSGFGAGARDVFDGAAGPDCGIGSSGTAGTAGTPLRRLLALRAVVLAGVVGTLRDAYENELAKRTPVS